MKIVNPEALHTLTFKELQCMETIFFNGTRGGSGALSFKEPLNEE